jgi:hypothetical protein
MIRSAVHQAECRLIDGKRCFIIHEGPFLNIMSFFFVSSQDVRFDPRIAAEGYENIQISLGARDTHDYYLCARMDPFLDTLWARKAPKEDAPK